MTDLQPLIDTIQEAAEGEALDLNEIYAFRLGDDVKVIDPEKYRPVPRRKRGTTSLADADSFAHHINKHALAATEVFADPCTFRFVAVFNAHEATGSAVSEGVAGWQDHRGTLSLTHTPAWLSWAKRDGVMLPQVAFAEHIEDRLPDIVAPPGAEMLELAQSFQAKRNVNFESSHALASGEVQLEYKEQIQAQAGRKGQIAIPREFVLGIPPFEGGEPYRVTARLRYRITDGALTLGYQLQRPEDILRDAFDAIRGQIRDSIDRPVLLGTPASA